MTVEHRDRDNSEGKKRGLTESADFFFILVVVTGHVRALVEVDEKNWDPKESEMERQWEAKRKEAAAAGLPSPATASVPVTDGSHHEGGGKGGGGGVKEAGTSDLLVHSITPVPLKAPSEATEGHGVKRPAESEPGSPAAASNTAAEGGSGAAGYGSSRRGRRGAPVDYAALNAQMEAAEAALAKDKINEGA